MNVRILHSDSQAQDKGDCRNHGLWDPYVSLVLCQTGSFSLGKGSLPRSIGTIGDH